LSCAVVVWDSLALEQRGQVRADMNFIHSDLGYRARGEFVQFTLKGNSANVRLMDSSNFNNYKNRRRYRFHGGRATKSLTTLQILRPGHWHAVVDMQGLRGHVNASIKILPGPAPTLQEAPLASVPSLVRNDAPLHVDESIEVYDVFISHASEDKDEVVRPLAAALQSEGLKVWYDEFELRIGDSLRRKIDRGLACSRFGLVILSPSFISKGWANYELDGIVARTTSGEQILLPIWHKLTKKEVMDYSPSLADRLARNTATYTIEEIAEEISELIKGE